MTKIKKTVIEKPEKVASPAPLPKKEMRQVIIETDGDMVRVVKNTTAGNFEFISILQAIIGLIVKGK